MKTFNQFVYEDAGEKFRAMSDSQFADYKKANPGSAAKADELRGGKKQPTTQTTSTKQISGDSKGGALAKTTPQTRTEPKKSTAIVKTPADKGSQMVKTKQAKETTPKPQPSVSDEKQAGQRPGTSRTKDKKKYSYKRRGLPTVKPLRGPNLQQTKDEDQVGEGESGDIDGGSRYISRTKQS